MKLFSGLVALPLEGDLMPAEQSVLFEMVLDLRLQSLSDLERFSIFRGLFHL